MEFSLNAVWSRAVTLVGKNFQLLALIAGIFMLLPSLLFYVARPDVLAMLMQPAQDPEALARQIGEHAATLVTVFSGLMMLTMLGYAAMVRLIGPDRVTVGEAIGTAFRVLPTLIACLLIFIVGYFVASIGLSFVTIAVSLVVGPNGATALMSVMLLVLLGYVFSRLCVMMPVIVNDGIGNPFTAYARSWKLTRPAAWRIFGFFLLLTVAYFVVSLLFFGVIGMLSALAGGTFIFGLISSLIGMVVAMMMSGILVSIHEQLAPAGRMGDTFA